VKKRALALLHQSGVIQVSSGPPIHWLGSRNIPSIPSAGWYASLPVQQWTSQPPANCCYTTSHRSAWRATAL